MLTDNSSLNKCEKCTEGIQLKNVKVQKMADSMDINSFFSKI